MKTIIIGAGLSGLLAAKKLINQGYDDIIIIEKGKSIIDRIIDFKTQKSSLSPYGEGGRIFFNFKPFIVSEFENDDKEFIDILKGYKLYNKNGIVNLKDILDLIKFLHFELSEKINIIYNNPVVDFHERNSKLGGITLKDGNTLGGDNFIFSFGLLDKFLYNRLWNKNVGLKSLSTFIPLKTSILLQNIEQFEILNNFIESKPLLSFDGRVSFIDEYQKETNIVKVKSSDSLLSFENFSFYKNKTSQVSFNLNISITEAELSGFQNSSLKNLALLSLIERNQCTASLRNSISYKNFLEDNIFDDILSTSISEIFKKSLNKLFKDFDDDFKNQMNVHGISTISLRPIQIISDSKSRSITYPNAIVVGNAKKNFLNLKSKIIDTLNTLNN